MPAFRSNTKKQFYPQYRRSIHGTKEIVRFAKGQDSAGTDTKGEPEWAPKYVWNYRATLRAAIQFWIETKELFIYNPVDRVKVDKKINVMGK